MTEHDRRPPASKRRIRRPFHLRAARSRRTTGCGPRLLLIAIIAAAIIVLLLRLAEFSSRRVRHRHPVSLSPASHFHVAETGPQSG